MHKASLAAMVILAGTLGGCSTGTVPQGKDAQAEMLDSSRQMNERQIALEQTWNEAVAGQRDKAQVRESFKTMIWKGSAPDPVRVRALELLLSDTSPEAIADTRNLMRLRMPTESSWAMLGAMSKAIESRASEKGWTEMAAPLVRSYARKVPTPTDPERPERAALLALHPGRSVEATVYDVFLRPVENGATTKISDWAQKTKEAAWELLGRLDADGSARATLLAADTTGDPAVRDLSRCARELGVVPLTGSELAWLTKLLNDKDPTAQAWWSAASAACAGLTGEQRRALQLRHVEGVRWAAAHRPEWLRRGREELLSELQSRLGGARIWRKTEGLGLGEQISRETLGENSGELAFGDVLVILVTLEALGDREVVAELFKQSESDRADTSTEYGGIMLAAEQAGGVKPKGPFVARGFAPRPNQRVNDRTFVASQDMFEQSPRALLHYHFHVQSENNADYAGPGRGDLEYADTHGRSCLVLTSVRPGIMNVDYYQRGGGTVDLGEIRR